MDGNFRALPDSETAKKRSPQCGRGRSIRYSPKTYNTVASRRLLADPKVVSLFEGLIGSHVTGLLREMAQGHLVTFSTAQLVTQFLRILNWPSVKVYSVESKGRAANEEHVSQLKAFLEVLKPII
jgi:hypothetical protein